MTNEELDRWLAVNVMRAEIAWSDSPFPLMIRYEKDGRPFCTDWSPSEVISQAIAAVEKARADGKIAHYSLDSPTPPHLPEFRAAVYFHDRRGNVERRQVDAPGLALALCRALHGALS